MRRFPAVAFATVVLLSLVSCTAAPEDGQVVGNWASEQGGQLLFAADGTFDATDFLAQALDYQRPEEERVDGGGSWDVSTRLVGDSPTITLEFNQGPIPITTPILISDPWWADLRLFFYIGDPDAGVRYEFVKESDE